MRDILKFIGKVGVLSFAFVCLTFSFAVNAQESSVTSGKIQIDSEKATKTSETSSNSVSVFKTPDSAPYRFSKGQRDPFVPFGGNIAPTPVVSNTTFDMNLKEEPNDNDIVKKSSKEEKDVEEPIVLPVQATGVLLSSDHAFAILAPAVGKDTKGKDSKASTSNSFLVGVGDKIGEYTVQSITNDKVVLIWQGKPYSIPVQQYSGNSKTKDGKAVIGEAPEQATLPVPEIKKKEENKENSKNVVESSKTESNDSQESDSANKENTEQKN
jgi:hypothetical protein